MLRFTKIFALLLLFLWVPASLHCAMDKAGLFETEPACCEDKADHAEPDSCNEHCAMSDGGLHRLSATVIKAPSSVSLICVQWVALPVIEPLVIPQVLPETTLCPPELSRSWQFLVRAALPLRAPPVV